MPIEPSVEHGEGTRVDDSESVRLSSFEGNRRILVESRKIFALVSDVDESGVCEDESSVLRRSAEKGRPR